MFEGGPIEWLKEREEWEGDLKSALEDKYGKLSETAEKRIDKLGKIPEFTYVFHKDVEVLWKDLTTESAKHITFRLTGFYKSVFDGMTLSHIQLNAPEWLENEKGRKILYKEEKNKSPSEPQLKNLADQYTQLKNNLERQGNYLHAGNFHYGEQEIRRRILLKDWNKLPNFGFWPWGDVKKVSHIGSLYATTTLYKWLSGYGERLGKAIMVFLLLLFAIPFLLCWIKSGPPEKYFDILVQLIAPASWAKPGVKVSGDPAFYVFLIFSQIVLLGVQLPLLIMAVRRRFKR